MEQLHLLKSQLNGLKMTQHDRDKAEEWKEQFFHQKQLAYDRKDYYTGNLFAVAATYVDKFLESKKD
jgi:hypothetical protein